MYRIRKFVNLIPNILQKNNNKKLAHYDQRERERQEHQDSQTNQTKSEDIVLLEKQGRCSQKLRNNATGNLAQVTHTVGQNMTDISNIGNPMVCVLDSFPVEFFDFNFLPLIATNRCRKLLRT